MDLDHNSGGRPRREVVEAVVAWLGGDAANPSSAHAAGRHARDAIEEARDEVAALAGVKPSEVVFTSGGTEANDLALAAGLRPGGRVVSTAIEHASVLRPLEAARDAGTVVTLLAPDDAGRISPQQVADAVDGRTTLVSIGWANGEIGTVQPIAEITRRVRERVPAGGPLLHSDAVQAAGLCDLDLADVPLDLLSLSGHKLGALPGVGALVVRRGTSLAPRLRGGPQERERRAGTENVPGIVSFGVAARLARAERTAWARHAAAVREELWTALERDAAPVVRHGVREGSLANTLSVSFPGLRGDALVIALDLEGIPASTGSACAAGATEPSHVLRAIGCDEAMAASALRLSFGRDLDREGALRAAAALAAVVRRARGADGGAGPRPRGVGHAA